MVKESLFNKIDDSSEEVLQKLQTAIGDLPEIVKTDPALLAEYDERLKIDSKIYSTFIPSDTYKIECPILVFGGENDNFVNPAQLMRWSECTSSSFNMKTFNGGHFYIFDRVNRDSVFQDIITKLIDNKGAI
jgi:surfactin synthase thioesterase subunit